MPRRRSSRPCARSSFAQCGTGGGERPRVRSEPCFSRGEPAYSAPTMATNWPALPLDAWRDTKDTLHRWMQVVGKIRMALTPLINHWWNVPLYVSGRGLTTSFIPYGDRWFDIEFDFIDHVLRIRVSDGNERLVQLTSRSVADFFQETMSALSSLGIRVSIWSTPVEVSNAIPFESDEIHRSYDRTYVHRLWRVLALSNEVFTAFRSGFQGKCSPVHFFWGS